MDKLSRIRKLYELKKVYRANSVEKRKESSAEHTFSCLILADYFLSLVKEKLDRLKVYELLMYHDLVEIEAGDTPIHHEEKRKDKKEIEAKAAILLKEKIPLELKEKFHSLFREFEERSSREAKFAHAIDGLDAIIHELDYKKDWKGWNEAMLRKFYKQRVSEFKELDSFFEELMIFCRKNGFLN